MASPFSSEIGDTDEAFDAAADKPSDDFDLWISPPKRQPAQSLCTRWRPPAMGLDNFS